MLHVMDRPLPPFRTAMSNPVVPFRLRLERVDFILSMTNALRSLGGVGVGDGVGFGVGTTTGAWMGGGSSCLPFCPQPESQDKAIVPATRTVKASRDRFITLAPFLLAAQIGATGTWLLI